MGRGMEGGRQADRNEDKIIRGLDEELTEEDGVKPKTSIEEEMEEEERLELERARQQRTGK